MSKKVCVFLGHNLAVKIDEWEYKYLNDDVNDTFPYGYDRFDDARFEIKYVKINSKEKKFLLNNTFLEKLYLYLIKLPIELIKNDIIWTHYDKDGLYIAALRSIPILNRFLAKQLSCFVWLIDESKNFNKIKIYVISKLLKQIDKVIFHAKTEKNLFKEIYGINCKKLNHIKFGINIENYSNKKKNIIPPKMKSEEKNYILSVGNDRHRDYDTLISLSNDMKQDKFIIATKHILEGYKDNLKTLSVNLKEIRYLYNNCMCVVVPLRYNEHVSGCTTALEAAAMKKPVIISDVPGIDDYVIDGITGIIVPVGDKIALKNAIEKLKNNPDLVLDMGENAYNYVIDKFDTKIWANKHIDISKEILGMREKTWKVKVD